MKLPPIRLRFLVLTRGGGLNRHLRDAVDSLREENRILRAKLGGRRLRFTDLEGRRLDSARIGPDPVLERRRFP